MPVVHYNGSKTLMTKETLRVHMSRRKMER